MGLPCREEQNEDDWWINLVDRCREGVYVKTCISQHVKTSQETEEQGAKLVSVAAWRTYLVGNEARG